MRVFCLCTALVAAGASVGCAWITPPARVEGGFGARVGREVAGAQTDGGASTVDGRGELLGSVRASIHPLQLDRALLDRPADFGIGYLVDIPTGDDDGPLTHGGFLELSAIHPVVGWSDSLFSLSVRGQARVLFDEVSARPGAGAAIQIAADLVTFTSGPWMILERDAAAVGIALGELGVGAYIEGAYGLLDHDHFFTVSSGLVMRIPTGIGAGVAAPR